MNAYELANLIGLCGDGGYNQDAATMLRQQADRIAELEKESANLEQSLKNAMVFIENHKQTKPLTDEEILNEWLGNDRNFYYLARAIEERHGIK